MNWYCVIWSNYCEVIQGKAVDETCFYELDMNRIPPGGHLSTHCCPSVLRYAFCLCTERNETVWLLLKNKVVIQTLPSPLGFCSTVGLSHPLAAKANAGRCHFNIHTYIFFHCYHPSHPFNALVKHGIHSKNKYNKIYQSVQFEGNCSFFNHLCLQFITET